VVSCGALRFGIHREGGGTGCWNEPTTHTGVAAFPSPPGSPSTTLFYSIIKIEHRIASKVVFFLARRSPTVASRRKE